MPEAINPVKLYRPAFSSTNSSKNAMIPESPQDMLVLSNKDLDKKEEKKSFLEKFGIDIAAFTTGIVGIGAAVKMGRINKQLNQKAVSILESVGVKTSPIKSFFKRNIANLEEIESVLVKDKLTGLPNRRYLDEYSKKAFNKAKKDGSELHVFMFDIDKFKNVNTALEHSGGDTVLKRSSDVISKIIEEYKAQGKEILFARYGGEEFTLVVQDLPKEEALKIAEKLRSSVNKDKELKSHAADLSAFFKREIKKLEDKGIKNLSADEIKKLDELKNSGFEIVDKNNGFTISSGMCSLSEHKKIVNIPHDTFMLADLALATAKDTRNSLCCAEKKEVVKYALHKLDNAAKGKTILSVEEKARLDKILEKN